MSDNAKVAARLLAHAQMCEEAAAISWNEDISVELQKLAHECRKAAAELLRSRADDAMVSHDSALTMSNQDPARNDIVGVNDMAVTNGWKTNPPSRRDLAGTAAPHGGEHEIVPGARRRSVH